MVIEHQITLNKSPCAVCDRNVLVREQHMLSAGQLPNKSVLAATTILRRHERVMSTFSNYPGDQKDRLKGLVLSKHGFDPVAPFRMHVCNECYKSLKSGKMPEAALANGFWVGSLPDNLNDITFAERAAAYPVRIKGHIIALESRRVRNVPGTAKRSLRGTSVFYANDASSVAKKLPLASTDLHGMITVILPGRNDARKDIRMSDLRKLLGRGETSSPLRLTT